MLLCAGGLLGCQAASAQATTTVVAYDPNVAQRVVRPLELWPELQAELGLKNGDYLLLSLRGERVANRPDFGYYARRPLGMDTRRVALAYEHFWNGSWSWGATARYEWDGRFETNTSGDLFVPELLLRHRSILFGGLTFGQRLGVERQILTNRTYIGSNGPDGQFWTRLRVDVERLFPLGGTADGFALRPRLSYAASTHLRFQKNDTDAPERTIQYTSLRAEVGVRVSPAIDFTPWFAYQTQYAQSLVFTDASGNPVSGGKYNYATPTLGLDVRFTIPSAGGKADRVQLPTQH
jgi:hypothetical protein